MTEHAALERSTGSIWLRRLLLAGLAYAGLIVAFESMIGTLQPADASTLVIITQDENGTPHDRVVSRLENDGKLYVAANHWPRAWYRQALGNPEVQVALDASNRVPKPYRAVPIEGAEYDAVNDAHSLPGFFRFLTGFPPRELVRLDPDTPSFPTQ